MKLFRFGPSGQEKPGVWLDESNRLDVSAFGEDFNGAFYASGGVERLRSWLQQNQGKCPQVGPEQRLGPCVANPSKVVCIGLNYAKHAAETGAKPPAEPILFFKSTTSVVGPNDDLVIPRGSEKTDYEVEMCVVIGKRASYVDEAQAMDYVAGYCLHNDYSERAFQLERGGQWVKGKSCDTFAPLGPFVATKDEVPDPHKLRLWLKVNGEMRQDSDTSDLIFKTGMLVSYISQFMTLLPGDVISTGTPAGVGHGFKPPKYLKAGDVVELGVDGLGTSTQRAVACPVASA